MNEISTLPSLWRGRRSGDRSWRGLGMTTGCIHAYMVIIHTNEGAQRHWVGRPSRFECLALINTRPKCFATISVCGHGFLASGVVQWPYIPTISTTIRFPSQSHFAIQPVLPSNPILNLLLMRIILPKAFPPPNYTN